MNQLQKAVKGFTLIELLIVVAIIAILAAIAVPNFLEAQTRAKVSRVKSDMRSLATGVEAYRLDYNRLFPTARFTGQTRTFIWSYMTTPIAYMTSVPEDPFNNKDGDGDRVITIWGPDYLIGNTTIRHKDGQGTTIGDARPRSATFFSPYPEYSDGTNFFKDDLWAMVSFGPDQTFQVTTPTFPSPVTPYDPTNGTVSDGDILRFSGGDVYPN